MATTTNPATKAARKTAKKAPAKKISGADPRSTAASQAETTRLSDLIVEVAQLQRRLAKVYEGLLDYHETSGGRTNRDDGIPNKPLRPQKTGVGS